MKTLKIVDSTFSHNATIGLAGERMGELPASFRWDFTPGPANVKVWTDIRLKEAMDDPAPHKMALLLEPPTVSRGMYDWIQENQDVFEVILTHQRWLVEKGVPYRFYPFGGSWIRDWSLFPKTKLISMLVSEKGLTDAHKLRHEAARFEQIDAYGAGVNRYVNSKAEALRDYYFAVIIENDVSDCWFTEKLIDAVSQGCVPIYRGCPNIGEFFSLGGIIRWHELDELEALVKSLTFFDHEIRVPAVHSNLRKAREYQCPEDWIEQHYRDLLWPTA